MIKLLLKHKANPNLQDSIGNSPYHFAAIFEFNEALPLLEEGGGDGLLKNDEGHNVVEIAVFNKHSPSLQYFFANKKYASYI